jgi:UPF0755 protein
MGRRLLLPGALVVLFGGALAGFAYEHLRPARPGAGSRWFTIEPGKSLHEIARALESDGIIRDARVFTWVGRLKGDAGKIKAGRYRLSPGRSGGALLGQLVRGETTSIRIGVPEGLRLDEIAALVADSLGVDPTALVALARERPFLDAFGIRAESAEGYLLPATYEFDGAEDASQVLAGLLAEGRRLREGPLGVRASALGMSWHEVLTLASIIEAETARADERAKVSAVYRRRLESGMKLQADPTVLYALGVRGRSPTYAELETDSPFNTYRHAGLPPGPIGNPGLASIEAALYPDTTTTALFFVAQSDGSHAFSDTFEEHRAAQNRRNSE